MREETIYVAEDGSRFDSEEDCYDYEYSKILEDLKGKIITLDSEGNPTKDVDEVYYMYVADGESLIKYITLCEDRLGYLSHPASPGFWSFDNIGDCYYNLDNDIKSLSTKLDKLTKMKQKLEEHSMSTQSKD